MKKYINKLFLIGINFIDNEDNLLEQFQTHGVAEKIEKSIIYIRKDDNNIFTIPMDEKSIKPAQKGIYHERSTGCKIENPNFIAQWDVTNVNDVNSIQDLKQYGFQP